MPERRVRVTTFGILERGYVYQLNIYFTVYIIKISNIKKPCNTDFLVLSKFGT